jgi:hypothetical protein
MHSHTLLVRKASYSLVTSKKIHYHLVNRDLVSPKLFWTWGKEKFPVLRPEFEPQVCRWEIVVLPN